MARTGPRLTLLEVALIVSLLALVSSIFVPTFARRLRTNKLDEATEMLATMSRGARAYYEQHRRDCLPSAAGPTPETPSVDPVQVDFTSEETLGYETWRALELQTDRPIRFTYEYLPSESGCGLAAREAPIEILLRARGDLDGDSVESTFERRATIDRDGFHESGALLVHRRTE